MAQKRPYHYEGSMKNKAHGYIFTLVAVTIFAMQDGLSKYLGSHYPPVLVAMLRYWGFAIFVLLMAARAGGIRHAATTKRPVLQIFRGVLLVAQIVVMIYGFSRAGMAMSQSILQGTPLLITLLSVPLLGEKVGWRRLVAIVVGLFGVILIINPVGGTFGPALFLPLLGTFMFAIDHLLMAHDCGETEWIGMMRQYRDGGYAYDLGENEPSIDQRVVGAGRGVRPDQRCQCAKDEEQGILLQEFPGSVHIVSLDNLCPVYAAF